MSIEADRVRALWAAERDAARAALTDRDHQHLDDLRGMRRVQSEYRHLGWVTTPVAAEAWGVTRATAQRRLLPLVRAGLVQMDTDPCGRLMYRPTYEICPDCGCGEYEAHEPECGAIPRLEVKP